LAKRSQDLPAFGLLEALLVGDVLVAEALGPVHEVALGGAALLARVLGRVVGEGARVACRVPAVLAAAQDHVDSGVLYVLAGDLALLKAVLDVGGEARGRSVRGHSSSPSTSAGAPLTALWSMSP
jgi:hypothetical protein